MIKAVNRQIIEVNCPKDERFEKVVFFVRSDSPQIPKSQFNTIAREYCNDFNVAQKAKKSKRFFKPLLFTSIVSMLTLVAVFAIALQF